MFIATTSLTRLGVEACVDFIEAAARRVGEFWLPLPVEICRGQPVDLGPLERYLEPLLSLYHEVKGPWRCYGTAEELREREMAAAELAALVIKAKVYGRINLKEWDSYFAKPRGGPPRPALAIGAVPRSGYVICGAYPPNPLETATELWHDMTPEGKLTLARWVVKYVTTLTESINLDEAHFKILQKGWLEAYKQLK